MKKERKSFKSSKLLIALIVIVTILASMLALTACTQVPAQEDPEEPNTLSGVEASAKYGTFTADDSVKIAHLTDSHYYPLNYCFGGDFEGTEYHDNIFYDAKMRVESSMYIVATLNEVAANAPDIMVVSGDLTLNGEVQAHVEFANLLRKLQNEVRAGGNEDFQILVVPGNHDMYNESAVHFRNGGAATYCPNVTRVQLAKIYCGLGFPDMSAAEFDTFYATLTEVYTNDLPYTPDAGTQNFIHSTTAASVTLDWLYRDNGNEAAVAANTIEDYVNGDLSYYAQFPNNYTVLCVDEEVSDAAVGHYVGGLMYQNAKDFFSDAKANDVFLGESLIGVMHHNAIPHFKMEDSLLKDFTIYNWRDVCDYFAGLGVGYFFTGHMHSNDIATYTTFEGNVITDIETASATGYACGIRYATIERGTLDGKYADNFSSYIDLIDAVDFSPAFDGGYMNDDYITSSKLTAFVNGSHVTNNPSEYAVNKLFKNIIETMVYKFVNVDFIGGLGEMLVGIVPDSFLGGAVNLTAIKSSIPTLVNNLIDHIEQKTLADYVYTGDTADFKGTARGAKLCGYLDDIITEAIYMDVNSQGDSLFDFGMGGYLAHVSGLDKTPAELTDADKEAFENLANGKIVKTLLDILLDKETGLLRIVNGLFEEIDLAKDLTATQLSDIQGLLNTVLKLFAKTTVELDLSKFDLDALIPTVLKVLDSLDIMSLNLTGADGEEMIDNLISGYVTESLYTSLGEIAHDILYAFWVDDTADIEGTHVAAGEEKVAQEYRYTTALTNATHYSALPAEPASQENGKLPSMLTVTFGADPKTQKNFVWFTDTKVTGTQIQYCVGEAFDAAAAKTVNGEYGLYATTTASIDLGVFATLMHVEIGKHEVSLSGLTAGTTYSYRVGSEADKWWSETYTFTTAPADNEAFELLLITDIQASSKVAYDNVATIMNSVESVFENGYDFVLNCGDITDNSRNLTQWKYLLDNAYAWGNATQVFTVGNHGTYSYEAFEDTDEEYEWFSADAIRDDYNYVLNHYGVSYPEQDDTTGAYYSFDYSGVHFTVLNTNNLSDKNALSDEQYAWLLQDLKSTDKIKVVVMHKGLYSSGSHSYDADVIAMRAQLTSVFADNGVHLVLAGHDHTYSTTYYLDGEGNPIKTAATGKAKIGTEGTLYVTLGTLGDKFYNYVENEEVPVEFGSKLHDPTLANPTFAKLVYDGTDLYYYGYEYDLETGKISEIRHEWKWYEYIAVVVSAIAISGAILAVFSSFRKK